MSIFTAVAQVRKAGSPNVVSRRAVLEDAFAFLLDTSYGCEVVSLLETLLIIQDDS
jgi:hypothetical protein